MPVPTFDYQAYDYITIGAGTAGPVVASRLSENQEVTVAILEAGGENTSDVSRSPGGFPRVWKTEYDWQYNTVPQTGLNGRTLYQPRGRVVGGSSAINVGAWLRGTREDYEWQDFGAIGWNFETALKMFHKIEDTNREPAEYRGHGGMVYMSDALQPDDTTEKLIQAFVDTGFGERGDLSGENPYKAGVYQAIYKDLVRRTPADAYLSPEIRARPNLSVITDALVTKILFDENKKAIGVEFIKDGQKHTMAANKEVILAAGTYNTPKILKLSGVGPASELEKHNIPLVADVPGVGENLRDHAMIELQVVAPAGIKFGVERGASTTDAAIDEWRQSKTGPATYFTTNAVGLISADDETDHAPDMELIFNAVQNGTNKSSEFALIDDISTRSGYAIDIVLLQPKSHGNVTLRSTAVNDKPIINPNYLTDENDVDALVRGIRKTMKIFDAEILNPMTSEIHIAPTATDDEIKDFIHAEASSAFHAVGTCRIGDLSDPMTVVDSELKLRGVTGVRIADVSVAPMPNRGHTMALAVYIGEMAAEIIKNTGE